ncbi:hypothetical protein H2200_012040 [Cladophialophora chaetospira]|uniref:N-acetyltransferase domain-containing protein n=1 Tax=Cladophialophora chaetospira TaxID=386627 RepID=A0AA39CCH9_9EURO|nr:hypothetical protein H2200_012040 [Cladophialophora chaetospira]
MPQASLLSYFAKTVTTAVVAPSSRINNHAEDEHDVPNKRASAHVLDETREQVARSTTLQKDDASSVQLKKIHCATPAARSDDLESSNHPSDTPTDSKPRPSGNLYVPHLPAATISPVLESHLQAIRRLTATTLPVRYSDAFFKTTVTDPMAQQLSRVVLYETEPVGWIRCRLEPCSLDSPLSSKTNPPLSQIYIQALALLSPYRSLGLATILLNAVLFSVETLAEDPICIYAHVWEKNDDALEWYAKRGFKRVMLVERYYTRLRPSGAWLVRRELRDVIL